MAPVSRASDVDVLTFEVGDIRCAIDVAAVAEVLPAVAVRPLPGQPAFVAGVIDLRGTVIPVLDLRARFGGTLRAMALSDHLIAAVVHQRTVALWVDRVTDLVSYQRDALTPSTGLIVGTRALLGVARTPAGLVMIHDIDGFITQTESDALASLVAAS